MKNASKIIVTQNGVADNILMNLRPICCDTQWEEKKTADKQFPLLLSVDHFYIIGCIVRKKYQKLESNLNWNEFFFILHVQMSDELQTKEKVIGNDIFGHLVLVSAYKKKVL